MAGPVVTTLLTPNPASGTWAPTDNVTETVLASATAASGTYVLLLDESTQVDGDNIQINIYKSASGSGYQLFDTVSFGPNAPTFVMGEAGPYPTPDYIKFGATLLAGSTTSRTIGWRVINLNGT